MTKTPLVEIESENLYKIEDDPITKFVDIM